MTRRSSQGSISASITARSLDVCGPRGSRAGHRIRESSDVMHRASSGVSDRLRVRGATGKRSISEPAPTNGRAACQEKQRDRPCRLDRPSPKLRRETALRRTLSALVTAEQYQGRGANNCQICAFWRPSPLRRMLRKRPTGAAKAIRTLGPDHGKRPVEGSQCTAEFSMSVHAGHDASCSPNRTDAAPAGSLSQKAAPILHEPTPLLEHVAAPVSRLHFAGDRVREWLLRDLSRVGGALGAPVPEARPETVQR